MSNIINILTRTSNRPKGFKKCRESITNQSYKLINHIVSYDNVKDLSYLNGYNNITKVKVDSRKLISNYKGGVVEGRRYLPHNLYLNELLKLVKDGWVLFLDDDDMLYNENVINDMVSNLNDTDTIYYHKMRYLNGKTLPDDGSYKDKIPKYRKIGSPCFVFHSKWVNYSEWDSYSGGDYRFLEKLIKSIPKSKWVDDIYIQLNNNGGSGKRVDICG